MPLSGRALKVLHYRDGKEIANLANNPHYDFNYQDMMFYRNEVKIMPVIITFQSNSC